MSQLSLNPQSWTRTPFGAGLLKAVEFILLWSVLEFGLGVDGLSFRIGIVIAILMGVLEGGRVSREVSSQPVMQSESRSSFRLKTPVGSAIIMAVSFFLLWVLLILGLKVESLSVESGALAALLMGAWEARRIYRMRSTQHG